MKAYRTYDIDGTYMGRLMLDAETLANANVTRRGDVVRLVEPYRPSFFARVEKWQGVWVVSTYIDNILEEDFCFERASDAYLKHSELTRQLCI